MCFRHLASLSYMEVYGGSRHKRSVTVQSVFCYLQLPESKESSRLNSRFSLIIVLFGSEPSLEVKTCLHLFSCFTHFHLIVLKRFSLGYLCSRHVDRVICWGGQMLSPLGGFGSGVVSWILKQTGSPVASMGMVKGWSVESDRGAGVKT